MGDDQLTSGNGADTIYGDAHNVSMDAVGGIATVWNSTANLNLRLGIPDAVAYGKDTILAGGGNDLIAGDAWDVSLLAQGGQASQDGLMAFGWINGILITGGVDTISGDGGDDTLYGDMHSLSLSVQGGMVTGTGGNASAHMINTSITMRVDTISGGADNDVLYGDLGALSFSAVAGKDTSGIGDVTATFAGNIPIFTVGGLVADAGSTITFAGDILDGGSGNDFLSGDAVNLVGLDKFLFDPNLLDAVSNKIIWGNDTLTGGAGADTFAFTLVDDNNNVALRDGVIDGMQGNDIITDFVVGVDKLQFSGVADLTALNNATTSFTTGLNADGQGDAGDTLITYDGGGSITLYDVTLTAYPANTVFA